MAFANAADLATFTGDDSLDSARGELLVDMASAAIRHYAQQTFDLVEDDEVELRGTWSHKLKLPERPVVSVSSVKIGDVEVSTYRLVRDTLVRTGPGDSHFDLHRRGSGRSWGGPSYVVTVTYTHGFAADASAMSVLRNICLTVAARAASNPSHFQSVSVDGVSVVYGMGDSLTNIGLAANEQAMIDRFRHEWAS